MDSGVFGVHPILMESMAPESHIGTGRSTHIYHFQKKFHKLENGDALTVMLDELSRKYSHSIEKNFSTLVL